MKKTSMVNATAAVLLCFSATVAQAANIEYRLLLNGDPSPQQMPAPGMHQLDIEVRVTDHLIGPSSNIPAGIFQSAINLVETGDGLQFPRVSDGFGGFLEEWNSTRNPLFTTFFAGLTDQPGFEVFAQTGSIPPGDFDVNTAQAIGADGQWTNVFSGPVEYDGSQTELILEAAARDHLLADFENGVVGRVPGSGDQVIGASLVLGIPEPATFVMVGIGLLGLVSTNRRRTA